jgi:hypothetical protein
MAFVGVLCSLLFDLRTIGLIVVEWVGGKACVLSFGTDGFVGGFRRVGVGFVTTFTVFEPLVFPNVFAALESGFLPADTFFLKVVVVVGWLVCVFEWPELGSRIQLLAGLQGVLEQHRDWIDGAFGDDPSLWSSCHDTRLVPRVFLGVVVAEGGGDESLESALIAGASLDVAMAAPELSDRSSKFKRVCAAVETDISTTITT